ncbi:hypothetical protein NDU88_004445 [Pleurodeles waltl]|uniref:Uncharacterized protein n=1 Tax=Pleurodeles waltl TaxID=8319 RepID=A0AAV7ME23_PLEWA|nr:hypothetical protein NDU88_004445 [Pleurodeles waltl]
MQTGARNETPGLIRSRKMQASHKRRAAAVLAACKRDAVVVLDVTPLRLVALSSGLYQLAFVEILVVLARYSRATESVHSVIQEEKFRMAWSKSDEALGLDELRACVHCDSVTAPVVVFSSVVLDGGVLGCDSEEEDAVVGL